MTSRQGPVAEFCAALAELRRTSGLDVLTLARDLNISKTQLYSILSGEIKRPPDWARIVGPLVAACTAGDARAVARWRQRHAVLVLVWEELGRRDRSAVTTAPPHPGPSPGIVVPRHLPAATRHFAGRADELSELARLAGDTAGTSAALVVLAIDGTAGIGKTTLAVHFAHQVAHQFPEGQLYVNLRGFDEAGPPMASGEAIRIFLEALAVPADRIPASLDAQAGLWRSLLAGKRMLILLDNARDVDQVRPLLPASPGCLVIVTSRRQLVGLVTTEGASALALDVLTDAEARELIIRHLGTDRATSDPAAVNELIQLCAGLPLALSIAAARASSQPGFPASTRTLPRDIASFVGRETQLRQLMMAAESARSSDGAVGVFAVSGMAGVGKTAFVIHAAHGLAPRFPDGQVFLSLHGYTPGQHPLAAADALTSLLLTAGVTAAQIPHGIEPRMRLWRDVLAGKQMLLVLDDVTDHEQIRPLLPGTPGSLVLITSRRRLTALEDSWTISLDALPAEEAAELFVRLGDRPGLDTRDVGEIVRLCGYLPLAVGMLARQLHHHPAWSAADLGADMAAARDRLELMTAEDRSVAASFELSYRELSPDQQRLFRRLGVHPGPDIDIWATASLDETDPGTARRHLNVLYDHYLLLEPDHGRFRFHDLVHQYAGTLAATGHPAERDAARNRLFGFYLSAARAASGRIARRTAAGHPASATPADVQIPDLATPNDAVRWLEAERLNLDAVVTHASAHGQSGYATALPAAMHTFLLTRGYSDQGVRLHGIALSAAIDSGDRQAQAQALADLGELQRRMANFEGAAESQTRALRLYRDLGYRLGAASALTQLGWLQYLRDDYRAAVDSLTQALGVYREIGDPLGEADALNHLGYVRYVTDDHLAATACLTKALSLYRGVGDRQGEIGALNYLAVVQTDVGDYPQATACFSMALSLCLAAGDRSAEAAVRTGLGRVQCLQGDCDEAIANLIKAVDAHRAIGNGLGEATALNCLGRAQRITEDFRAAVSSQEKAIGLYRARGSRLGEADARLELGAAHLQAGNLSQAEASLNTAFELYRAVAYRLGQAETLNNIGDLLLATSEPALARARYEAALALTLDAAAPLVQAQSLDGVGRSYLAEGRSADAHAPLRRALEIYQRIGSPRARQAQQALRIALNGERPE